MSTADAAPVSAAEACILFADLDRTPTLLLAVSGGPDSMALLHLAAQWRAARETGPALMSATVDHGLRPPSAAEAAAVERVSSGLGVPHRTLCWLGPKPPTGLQEAARHARYRLLAEAAREAGAGHVLTAHTRDDQAETVLLRLARGSGLAGLAGMARASPLDGLVLVRPLLDLPKARLIATLQAAQIPFVDDASNHDPRFTRVRLRGLMPALAAEGLDSARLARLARRLARADAALEAATTEALVQVSVASPPASGGIVIDAAGFSRLPAEVALRVLHRVITRKAYEGPVELAKLEVLLDALEAARSGGPHRLRRTLAGAMVTLEAGRLVIAPAPRRRQRAFANGASRQDVL
ncbi:MAG: tRNA lysidine(34) synthetase TilS [Xanthobacteraceae bacterium]